MTHGRVQLAILGGGPAGIAAADEARRRDCSSILLLDESGQAGGNIGCAYEVRNVPFLADRLPGEVVANELRAWQQRIGVSVIKATIASIHDTEERVELVAEDGRRWHADALVVAIGTQPRHPRIPGLAEQFDSPWASSAAQACEQGMPNTVAVIGGGDVAFDQARWLRARGVCVSVLCRAPRARAPRWLEEAARREGIDVVLDCNVLGGERVDGQVRLSLQQAAVRRTLMADRLVAAIGRVPRQLQGMVVGRGGRCRLAGDVTGRAARHVVVAMGEGCAAASELLDGVRESLQATHEETGR